MALPRPSPSSVVVPVSRSGRIASPWVQLAGAALARPGVRPLFGHFVERPNRFVAKVRLPELGVVEAHVPNPGRLTGTLVPGCEVLVEGAENPKRRLRYTLLAAREGQTWVGTVTTFANRIFPSLWRAGLFPELAGSALASEVRCGHSRFDFQVGETLVEVKSVTLVAHGRGLFPDAVTARGARHCDELAALSRAGRSVAVVFLAQRADIECVVPEDDIDPVFGRALRAAAASGVRVLAGALALEPGGVRQARRIPVVL